MASSSSLGGVFLSFRGIDTRRKFVGHLHKALVDRGIITFKDEETITTGKPFPEEILSAIKNSSFAIIVISENFTSSKWCLIELQSIMELRSRNKIFVFPIFYGVEPSDLRKEGGHSWKPLKRHRRSPFSEEVPKWKEALKNVSYLQGKDPRKFNNDATLIDDIVGEISMQLLSMLPINLGDAVGMLPHMERLGSLINMRSEKVRMIGIWGMGGIGKTTIAKYLFNQYSRRFSACCFLGDTCTIFKTFGLMGLQEKFISSILPEEHLHISTIEHGRRHIRSRLGHKRVFVVIDGVETVDQIQALAKETSMFGQGSRIIITTRDKSLLRTCGFMEEDLYEVHCLESHDAHFMFKLFAFKGGIAPSDAYEQLSIRASQLAHGLPYALEAFGLCFRGKTTISEWEDEVRRLETTPHENTLEILKTSYKDLSATDKNIFLHIACLFNGDSVLRVRPLLDNFEFGIEGLSDKSLIKISTDGYIKMHVLVEQTGKQIVHQESKKRTHKQLILWDPQNICKILRHNSGTDQIHCLALHMCQMSRKLVISCINFRLMHNLKIIKFYKHLEGIESKLQFVSEDRSPLDLELRLLHWDAYPLTTLPFDLNLECLVEINLCHSNLKILWDGTPELASLRKLNVKGSKNLRELPDLSTATNLEELLIDGCMRLKQYPRFIGNLSNMLKLHAIHCDGLRSLQIKIRAQEALQEPTILSCPHFVLEFPNEVEPLQSLANLSIEGKINFWLLQLKGDADHFSFKSHKKNTPYKLMMRPRPLRFLSSFRNFKYLEIKRNNYNKDDPPFECHSFLDFPLLTELNLINLKIEIISSTIGELQSLEKLNLSGNDFQRLPKTMEKLSKLKYMNLCNCYKLEELPPLHGVLELELGSCNKVQSLSKQLSYFTNLNELDLSKHDFVTVPESIKELSSLRTLTLNNCKKLRSLEELPLSLKCLYAHGCCILENVSLSSTHCLEDVDLHHCFRLKLDDHIITRFPPNSHGEMVTSRCCCSQGTTSRLSVCLRQIKLTHMLIVKAISIITLVTLLVNMVLCFLQ